MRWIELDFENWNECWNKNRDKIVNDIEHDDDERFSEALIRDAEISEVENVNRWIETIWLKKDVFVYKQRAFQFEMSRFEN
jgi:hypothetical protein